MYMKKTFIALVSAFALFCSCSDDQSFKSITMDYVSPDNGVIPAEGGEIEIKVNSTHSFQMTSSSAAFSFFRDGMVNYDKDGVAIVTTSHKVNVTPNTTGSERRLSIIATQLSNADMRASLQFIQPAMEEETPDTPSDEVE